MKKYIQKSICFVLALTMTVWGMAGCGTSENPKDDSPDNEKTASDVSNTTDMEALLTGKVGNARDTDKKETVYVEMQADGTVKKTTVSDKLKVSGSDNISDTSGLENITNIGGEEKFARDGNKIVWENKGKDISYQGTTTKSAPVNIKITYYLDDKEISAGELAGKSGKVKIVYDYINHTRNEEGDFIPFLMLTGMVLGDNFTNVSIDNGKVISRDESNIVIGYGAPGLKEYLLDSIHNADEYIGDIEIPESFTVTADVKDFSMDMTLTVATSQIGNLDLEDTFDFSELESQMNKLQEGTDQLVDGAGDLDEGANQLKDGSKQVKDGAEKLATYTGTLFTGTSQLLSQYKVFNKSLLDGVASANAGAKQIHNGTKQIKTASASISSGASQIYSAANSVDSGAKQISTGLKSAKNAFEDETDSAGNVKSQGLKSGAKSVADGTKTANAGVKEFVNVLQGTPDSIQTQIDGVVNQVKQATGGLIASKEALNTTVEGINNAVKGGMELSAVLAAKGITADVYYSLLQAYYSVQTLETVKTTFENQIASKSGDISALLTGMSALESGSAQISGGINQLYTGIGTLNTGADALVDGTEKLASGTKTMSEGAKELKTGASDLEKAMKKLASGTNQLNSKLGDASPKVKKGISKINSGAKQLNEGAGTLAKGTLTLDNGLLSLVDGTKELKSGAIKLNNEGISKITEIFGNDAKEAKNVIEDMLNAGKGYQSFSGIQENMSGDVKFIFRTEEIKSDK